MSTTVENISTAAAVVGLVVAALSALAAFRSAASAQAAQRWAEDASRRLALYNLSRAANDTLVELQRVLSRSQQACLAYDSLSVFSGSHQNAGIEAAKSNAKAHAERAQQLAEYARLFVDGTSKLKDAPSEEFDRVQLQLAAGLAEIAALREELDRTVSTVESQNSQFRERVLAR